MWCCGLTSLFPQNYCCPQSYLEGSKAGPRTLAPQSMACNLQDVVTSEFSGWHLWEWRSCQSLRVLGLFATNLRPPHCWLAATSAAPTVTLTLMSRTSNRVKRERTEGQEIDGQKAKCTLAKLWKQTPGRIKKINQKTPVSWQLASSTWYLVRLQM